MATASLQDRFEHAHAGLFAAGVTNIKVTVNPEASPTVDELKEDMIAFQSAIDAGRVQEVASVD